MTTPAEIPRGYDPFARAALAPFGFSPQAELSLLSLSENATYRVDDPDRGLVAVLRVHRTGYHPPGAVESELAWLQALRQDEVLRTPAVFRAPDGRQVVDISLDGTTRQTVLFEFVPGTEPPEDQLAGKFELLGGICARMHRHARGWARPASFSRFRWDFDCMVGTTPRWGRWQDGIGGARPRQGARPRGRVMEALRRFGSGPTGSAHPRRHAARQPAGQRPGHRGHRLRRLRLRLVPVRHRRVAELHRARPAGARAHRRLAARLPRCAAAARGRRGRDPHIRAAARLQLVSWVGSHRFADSALELGADFTQGACELAERYLVTTPQT